MKLFDAVRDRIIALTQPLRELISRRTNDWLVGAMGVFILLNTGFILIPLLKSFYNVSTRSSVLKRDIGEIEEDKKNETKLVQARDAKNRELAERQKVLALGDVSFYLESFSELAKETNVRVQSIRPVAVPPGKLKDPKTEEFYRGTYFEIAAGASYHALGRFVQKLENQPAFVKIVRLSVSAPKEPSSEHDVKMLVKMVVRSERAQGEAVEKS